MKPVSFWRMGDVALGRLSKQVYVKVQVVKDVDGLFYDDKVLGISANGDNIEVFEELCYYVEVLRSKERIWLPYTSMYLAGRSRPFYGTERVDRPKKAIDGKPSPRKKSEDDFSDLSDQCSDYEGSVSDIEERETLDEYIEKIPFEDFIHCGKEVLFDELYDLALLDCDEDVQDYLLNVNASTEDKFEELLRNIATENEIDNYLKQCWRYAFVVHFELKSDEWWEDLCGTLTVHTNWCLVCGKTDALKECTKCPAAFHGSCSREWLISVIHRKSPLKVKNDSPVLVEKVLSSTRVKCMDDNPGDDNQDLCPSCRWGPKVGYNDIVWHKLDSCSWWPARVLTPCSLPLCLMSSSHEMDQWPVRYYGTLNHSWANASHMCLFLPKHTTALNARDDILKQAMLDASDDYIAVYLR
ncbi:unnamed protein product [Pieris macdunnoughi]|uniref:PWWP domain-containing protein n=1 Tax=Pieris macdunnoughi TaxID=345717 RepID=A0A821TJP1_9NEOP|nr:unnamed protein product [Pieris macdunnoughi]